MKKHIDRKKIVLDRQTIRPLDLQELDRVSGGGIIVPQQNGVIVPQQNGVIIPQ